MGIELSNDEFENVLQVIDKEESGLIDYKRFIEVGVTVIHGIFIKNEVNSLKIFGKRLINF